MACRVLIFGHTFVRTLDSYMNGEENPSCANLGLDKESFLIHCYGVRGGTISPGPNGMFAKTKIEESVGQHRPHVVFLQLGGYDLLHEDCDPEEIARDLVIAAAMLIDCYGVHRVVIGQLLPRFNRPSSPYYIANYKDLVVRVNKELSALVSAADARQDIRYWKHRGFWNNQQDVVESDGVHLNAYGIYKYAQSVRAGVAGTARQAALV